MTPEKKELLQYQNLLLALLHKLSPGKMVTLTQADFQRVMDDHKPVPHLFTTYAENSIEIGVVDADRARAIRDFQTLQDKAAIQQ